MLKQTEAKAAGLYIDRKIIKTGKLEDLCQKQELENKDETNSIRLRTANLNAKTVEGESSED